jgi:hypothetical protein
VCNSRSSRAPSVDILLRDCSASVAPCSHLIQPSPTCAAQAGFPELGPTAKFGLA